MNLGNVSQKMYNFEEAIICYQKALALDENFSTAYLNLGFVYQALRRVDDAIKAFQKVLDLDPENDKALVYLYHQYRYACDWRKMDHLSAKLDAKIKQAISTGRVPAEPPFLNITRCMDPYLNHCVARLWSKAIEHSTAMARSSTTVMENNGLRKKGFDVAIT